MRLGLTWSLGDRLRSREYCSIGEEEEEDGVSRDA